LAQVAVHLAVVMAEGGVAVATAGRPGDSYCDSSSSLCKDTNFFLFFPFLFFFFSFSSYPWFSLCFLLLCFSSSLFLLSFSF
jgi:hypothetical protein